MNHLLENWADQVRAGDVRAISRAMSAIENRSSEAEELLKHLFPHTGRAFRVGITGAPGTGKSTLVDQMAAFYRRQGKTVGIFIRSMATRGYLGGVAQATGDATLLLDAAGKDVILIETVGVGQAEIEV